MVRRNVWYSISDSSHIKPNLLNGEQLNVLSDLIQIDEDYYWFTIYIILEFINSAIGELTFLQKWNKKIYFLYNTINLRFAFVCKIWYLTIFPQFIIWHPRWYCVQIIFIPTACFVSELIDNFLWCYVMLMFDRFYSTQPTVHTSSAFCEALMVWCPEYIFKLIAGNIFKGAHLKIKNDYYLVSVK